MKFFVFCFSSLICCSCTLTTTTAQDQGPTVVGTVTGMVLGERWLMISLKVAEMKVYGR